MDPVVSNYFHNDIYDVICISQQGELHKKYNLPCQDYSEFRFIDNNILIAAIADGIGSCKEADIGARLAVNASLDYLNQTHNLKNMLSEQDDNKIFEILNQAMSFSVNTIKNSAYENGKKEEDYSTTLSIIIIYDDTAYYSHIGDAGIVIQNIEGDVKLVTNRHKGDTINSVVPLQMCDYWQFGKANQIVCLIMATDGLLDLFVESPAKNNQVYYPFVESLLISNAENDVAQTCQEWNDFLSSNTIRTATYDDITLLVIMRTSKL